MVTYCTLFDFRHFDHERIHLAFWGFIIHFFLQTYIPCFITMFSRGHFFKNGVQFKNDVIFYVFFKFDFFKYPITYCCIKHFYYIPINICIQNLPPLKIVRPRRPPRLPRPWAGPVYNLKMTEL